MVCWDDQISKGIQMNLNPTSHHTLKSVPGRMEIYVQKAER